MNGPEMLISSVLKLLKIDDAVVNKSLDDLRKVGAVAQALNDRMARIEDTQNRILELLSQEHGFDHSAKPPTELLLEQSKEEN